MQQLGNKTVGSTVRLYFNTNAANGTAITFTGDVTNTRIYKDGGTTQRSSTAGCVLLKDFDGIVGTHLLTVDLSDNTDAGFYVAGHDYSIMLELVTVDSKTVSVILAQFFITSPTVLVKSSAYTILSTDTYILASGNTTISLPIPTGLNGKIYYIKKMDDSTTTLTVDTVDTALIDGQASFTITAQYTTMEVTTDGTNWYNV